MECELGETMTRLLSATFKVLAAGTILVMLIHFTGIRHEFYPHLSEMRFTLMAFWRAVGFISVAFAFGILGVAIGETGGDESDV